MTRSRFRSLVVVFTVLTMPSAAFSQSSWHPLPAAPVPSSRVNDGFFVSPDRGWIAGGSGYIYRTTDGGASWQSQFTNSSTHFRSLGFVDSLTGWAGCLGIGDANNASSTDTTILYKTTNGGSSWIPEPKVSGAVERGFCGMSVVNDSVVYGVGRVRGPAYFYRTTNRGETWETRDMVAFAAGLIDVHFFSVDSGIVVGLTDTTNANSRGVVLMTGDRGNTWSVMWTTTRTGEWCWKISFPSRNVGYVSLQRNSSGFPINFLKTSDGGISWQEKLFSSTYYFVQGIGFVNDSLGWIGGTAQHPPMVSTNGGESWDTVTIGVRINRFRFLKDNLGYAVGSSVFKYESVTSVRLADRDASTVRTMALGQNYPNPFNPTTTIRFTIAEGQTTVPVRLTVFDALGRELEALVDEELEAGTHERIWNASRFPSGSYYYRLQVGGVDETKKLLLVR